MGSSFQKFYVYISSFDWDAPLREYMGFEEPKVREFIEKNPMPLNNHWESADDVVNELCTSTGILTLPSDTSDEMLRWFEYLITETTTP